MPEKNIVDTYNPLEFWLVAKEEFGTAGALNTISWCIFFGASGGETKEEMRSRLIATGFARTAVYDAANKIERLQKALHRKRGIEPPVSAMAAEIKSFDFTELASGKPDTVL